MLLQQAGHLGVPVRSARLVADCPHEQSRVGVSAGDERADVLQMVEIIIGDAEDDVEADGSTGVEKGGVVHVEVRVIVVDADRIRAESLDQREVTLPQRGVRGAEGVRR